MALTNAEIGKRVEALRIHKGMSREACAGLADISVDLLKSIEVGRRRLTLRAAERLTRVLGAQDLSDFFGPTVQLALDPRPTHEAMPAVRKALTAWYLNVDGPVSSPEFLRGAIDTAWSVWHGSKTQRSEVAAMLPRLLTEGQRASRQLEGVERRQALSMLSQTYHLAQAFMAWHGDRDLVWLAVDRGVTTAIESDDPLTIAAAYWYAAHLLRALGRSDEALDRLREARELVERSMPDDAPDEWVAMMADLWFNSALTKARSHDQAAWADWNQADQIVQRLPENYVHPWTRVGRVLSGVNAVMVATELGDPDEARRRAQEIDPASIPSVDRRARHYIELARGAFQDGSKEGAVHLLTQANKVSRETVAYTPPAQEIIHKLRSTAGAALRPDVEELATPEQDDSDVT